MTCPGCDRHHVPDWTFTGWRRYLCADCWPRFSYAFAWIAELRQLVDARLAGAAAPRQVM